MVKNFNFIREENTQNISPPRPHIINLSWVDNLALMASPQMNVCLGIVARNQTSFHQFTSSWLTLISFQAEEHVNFPDFENTRHCIKSSLAKEIRCKVRTQLHILHFFRPCWGQFQQPSFRMLETLVSKEIAVSKSIYVQTWAVFSLLVNYHAR